MAETLQKIGVPGQIAIYAVALFVILQIVGEIVEFCGKSVPMWMKVRKWFKAHRERKAKREKTAEILEQMAEHYTKEKLSQRDEWIATVNAKMKYYDGIADKLTVELATNNAATLEILIDIKRNAIINFAADVADGKKPVTQEQFKRIFAIYEEYEKILKDNHRTNGQVEIAVRIIRESYAEHLKNHSFIEDVRGYSKTA